MSDEVQLAEVQPQIPRIAYETAEQAIPAFIQLTQTGILKPENFQLEGQSVLHQTILDNFSPDKFRGKIHTVDTTGFSQYQYDLDTMPLEIPVENYIEASGIWFLRLNKENLTPNMIGIAAMGYKPALFGGFLIPSPFKTFTHTFSPQTSESTEENLVEVNGVIYSVKTNLVLQP